MNVREIWDKASEINLYGYLGHGKGLNEIELQKLAHIIFEKLKVKNCGLLLNAGCGVCSYDIYLAPHVKEIVGIDVSPKIIQKALYRIKQFNSHNIHLIIGDILNLPLRPKVTDACISLGVIKHIPNNPYSTIKALMQINRVTKGKVYINDLPNLFSVEGIFYKVAIFIWTKVLKRFTTGTYLYIPSQLARFLRISGCKMITWYGCGYKFPFSSILKFIPLIGHLIDKFYIKPVLTGRKFDRISNYFPFSSIEVTYKAGD